MVGFLKSKEKCLLVTYLLLSLHTLALFTKSIMQTTYWAQNGTLSVVFSDFQTSIFGNEGEKSTEHLLCVKS